MFCPNQYFFFQRETQPLQRAEGEDGGSRTSHLKVVLSLQPPAEFRGMLGLVRISHLLIESILWLNGCPWAVVTDGRDGKPWWLLFRSRSLLFYKCFPRAERILVCKVLLKPARTTCLYSLLGRIKNWVFPLGKWFCSFKVSKLVMMTASSLVISTDLYVLGLRSPSVLVSVPWFYCEFCQDHWLVQTKDTLEFYRSWGTRANALNIAKLWDISGSV